MPKSLNKTANWKAKVELNKKGRPCLFIDLAITTPLMVKRIFSMSQRALQGFINSAFKLGDILLSCPHYTCISKRTKTVNIAFQAKTLGTIEHLAIDSTGFKEWKVKNMAQMGSV